MADGDAGVVIKDGRCEPADQDALFGQCLGRLCRFPEPSRSAAEATKALAGQGILIRRFASPIFHDYARITIGHEQELRRAVTALEAFLRQAAA
ncbi:MAG: hypothetical protein AAFR68_22705 [Pseudomonadota bacterium]